MKFRRLRLAAATAAAAGLLVPSGLAVAVEPAPAIPAIPGFESPLISDVVLGPGGMLPGQVVDSSGHGVPGMAVTIRHNETLVASTVSGADGQFAVRGLQGGVFQISAGQGVGIYRVWTSETAPPAAGKAALVVSDRAVRGQSSRLGQFLANPLVIAGIVAVAVAVPVAVHQYHVDHKSGS